MKINIVKLIGVNQLIGGVAGIISIPYLFYIFPGMLNIQETRHLIAIVIFFSILTLFFFVAALAGYWLLKGKNIGLYLSRLIQILQVPYFVILNNFYSMGVGLHLFISLSFPKFPEKNNFIFSFSFMFPIKWEIDLGSAPEGLTLGLNLVAVLSCLYLCFWGRKSLLRK